MTPLGNGDGAHRKRRNQRVAGDQRGVTCDPSGLEKGGSAKLDHRVAARSRELFTDREYASQRAGFKNLDHAIIWRR